MKKSSNLFILILSMLFFNFGCSKNGLFNQPSKVSDRKTSDRFREPLKLNAKMVDNITAPSDAEIISDKKNQENSPDQTRTITLNVPASVYDVDNFYRTEMPKNAWKISDRNDRPEREDSILSFLDFTTDKEEARIEISDDGDNKSQVNITIEANLEYKMNKVFDEDRKSNDNETKKIKNGFPMPSCADKSNTLIESSGLTISGDCSESISSISKFFREEAPKNNWKLKDQNEKSVSSDSVILIFLKDDQKALVTIIQNKENSISLSVRISR